MKHVLLLILFSLLLSASVLDSKQMEELAKTHNLYAGSKASIQWERVFSSERHLKRYKLENIPEPLRTSFKLYLIEHAADSAHPIVPGL